MADKKKSTKPDPASPADGDDIQPHPMTGDVRTGMIVGAVVGALYGLAYATIPKIVKLDVGPVPGIVIGLFFGAGFGLCFGGYIGGIGRDMLKPKAFLGFAAGFLIMLIGRLADSTGEARDKIMDILVGGTFWGCVGAIAAALGVFDAEAKTTETKTEASPAETPATEQTPAGQ